MNTDISVCQMPGQAETSRKSQNRTPYEDNHGNQDRRSESSYEVAEDNDLAGVCFHRIYFACSYR